MIKNKNLKNIAKCFFILLPTIANAQSIDLSFSNNLSTTNDKVYRPYDWGHKWVSTNVFLGSHTGQDYSEGMPSSISFGKVSMLTNAGTYPTPNNDNCASRDCGLGNSLLIRYLKNDGNYVYASYGHLANLKTTLNSFLVPKQEIGVIGKTGGGSNGIVHLHFEIKDSNLLGNSSFRAWGYIPKPDSESKPDLNPSDYGYFNPEIFMSDVENEVSLPILSRTASPDKETNFDVYGIANKPVYGYLNLTGTFQESAIVVRNFFTRANSENAGTLTATTGKFLGGKQTNQSVIQISGNSSYAEGDYLFLAYVKDYVTSKLRYGYPVKFSIVKEGDLIIDNDQKNADADSTNDLKTEPAYNGSMGLKVPGYFLTAELQPGRSNKSAQWKPYKKGNYKIYVHIPEYGATATSVSYVVKKDGTNPTAVNSKPIDQSANADKWVQITTPDGSDTFQFDDNGYIGLSLSSTSETANYVIDATQKVAFDAVKFEVGGNTNTDTAIGKTYQGGIVFYLDSTGKHGLIAAPTDQNNTGIQWYNGSYPTTGATGTAIGTGLANTNAIITAQGAGSYAAKLSADLVIGAYSDWYLPSKDELNLMYHNIGQGAAAPLTNVGGFAGYYYWSSSEYGGSNAAWIQYFGAGTQSNHNKDSTLYVRAVRAF